MKKAQYKLYNHMNLAEDLEDQHDISFYTECIQAYRKKNYEVI